MGMARRPPCACLRSAGQARGGLPHWRAGRRRAGGGQPRGPAAQQTTASASAGFGALVAERACAPTRGRTSGRQASHKA